VIENSQRDINIAFVNELAKIFNLMNIDTHAVLLEPNGIFCLSGLVGGTASVLIPLFSAKSTGIWLSSRNYFSRSSFE
jgi:UDP-N-acetyl-D-galactosamine dehydrogenase